MAIALKPDLLIADEPTTALDVTVQAEVLALLFSLRRELNMAMIFITHNLALLHGRADRVTVLYAGRMAECAPTAEIFHAPVHAGADAVPRPGSAAAAFSPHPGRGAGRGALPGRLLLSSALLADLPAGARCRFAAR